MTVRRLTLAALASLCALVAVLLAAASALALPPGRHYEMVSPPYKAGYGVSGLGAVAPDGEAAVFSSLGAFDGAPAALLGNFGEGSMYIAHRTPTEWSTTPLLLPATVAPSSLNPVDFSATLESSVFSGRLGPSSGIAKNESHEGGLWLHPTAAPDRPEYFFQLGGLFAESSLSLPLSYYGGSPDLSHIVIHAIEEAVTPEAKALPTRGGFVSEYDFAARPGAESSLRLIGLDDSGEPVDRNCEALIGADRGQHSEEGALAADGGEIFFSGGLANVVNEGACSAHTQLFVTLDGRRTLEVSKPLGEACSEVPCAGGPTRAPAEFVAASPDGTHVFFRTEAPLVGTDTSSNLYVASIGCPPAKAACALAEREVTGLERVSLPLSGAEQADVQGIVAASPDSSHLYFVAHGVLAGVNAEGASPMAGADNLYVYERDGRYPTGHLAFVAQLCSGADVSGSVEDQRCPVGLDKRALNGGVDKSLWTTGNEAQTADDGRFLVFPTFAQLTSNDTDKAKDIYRYDAQTEALVRVSVGEGGYHANGNGEDTGVDLAGRGVADAGLPHPTVYSEASAEAQAGLGFRAVSEDGSRIVFTTDEPLSPDATNGKDNAYEWHEGQVSLVSTGSDSEGVENAVITPSGSDIFFTTVQKLLPADTDEAPDVYDARLGAGFPPAPQVNASCQGDACQGSLTNPAPLLIPGSVSQAPGESVTVSKHTKNRCRRNCRQARRRGRRHRRRKACRHRCHHKRRRRAHKSTRGSGR